MNVIYTRRWLFMIIIEHVGALVDYIGVRRSCLSANKAVNFQHSNLEIARRAQWWIVECLAGVWLSKSDILIHPDSLTITKIQHKLLYNLFKLLRTFFLPAANRYHFIVGCHEQLCCVANALATFDAYPRIFSAFWIQREQERLASTEIRLSLAAIIFQVSLAPSWWAVSSKHLKNKSNWKNS